MQKLISKYATAAHLALLVVAPLFLLPFCGTVTTATVLLWLSAFAITWDIMEPSRRNGEMPHDARARVARMTLTDPLSWFSLLLVFYTGLRALNGGVGMLYDAELMVWTIAPATMPLMPGCLSGAGYFPFAATVALVIVFHGTRFTLGRSARAAFFLISSFVSGLSAIALAFAISYGHAGASALAVLSSQYVHSMSFFGTAFAIMTLCSAVAVFASVERKWVHAEPLAGFALVANAIGVAVFCPPFTIAVFAAAFLILAIVSFVLTRNAMEGSGSFRCALAVLLTLVAPVLYALATDANPVMAEKIAFFKSFTLFPADFFAQRDALASISLRSWKVTPWLGTGLDSFPLDVRFFAVADDWKIVSPAQTTAINGFWQLLAERGAIGALVMAVTLAILLWTYVRRLVLSFSSIRLMPEHFIGPIVLLAMIAISFFNSSYLRPEVMLVAGAAIAISGGALPVRESRFEEGKEH